MPIPVTKTETYEITDTDFEAALAAYLLAHPVSTSGPMSCHVLDAPKDGLSDATPAITAFLNTVMTSPVRRAYIPTGTYRLDSPLPEITTHINLFGDGYRSVLVRNYSGPMGKGVLTLAPGAHCCVLSDFCLTANTGTYGGAGLAILADETTNCDRILLDNLLISASTNLWVNSLLVDGSLKTTTPVGVRGLKIRDCEFFGANGYSAVFHNAPGTTWVGGAMYPAGGTNNVSGQYYHTVYAPRIRGVNGVSDAG